MAETEAKSKRESRRKQDVAAAVAARKRRVPHVHDDTPTREIIAQLRAERASHNGVRVNRIAPSDELVHAICERISNGETMREVLRSDPRLPTYAQIYHWIARSPELLAYYRRSKEIGMDALAEDMLAIADDARNDWMEKLDAKEQSLGWQLNGEHVQRSRLRIETRLKLLAKWSPARYGERLAVEGGDGPPIKTSDATLEKFAALIAGLAQRKRVGRTIDGTSSDSEDK